MYPEGALRSLAQQADSHTHGPIALQRFVQHESPIEREDAVESRDHPVDGQRSPHADGGGWKERMNDLCSKLRSFIRWQKKEEAN